MPIILSWWKFEIAHSALYRCFRSLPKVRWADNGVSWCIWFWRLGDWFWVESGIFSVMMCRMVECWNMMNHVAMAITLSTLVYRAKNWEPVSSLRSPLLCGSLTFHIWTFIVYICNGIVHVSWTISNCS